jgi:hypothetical protein
MLAASLLVIIDYLIYLWIRQRKISRWHPTLRLLTRDADHQHCLVQIRAPAP